MYRFLIFRKNFIISGYCWCFVLLLPDDFVFNLEGFIDLKVMWPPLMHICVRFNACLASSPLLDCSTNVLICLSRESFLHKCLAKQPLYQGHLLMEFFL